jgi:hypothetical protein
MNDRTGPIVENSMVLVFPRQGEAMIAALLEATMMLGAEIPAARALQQIPADGRDIPDLRTSSSARRIREDRAARRDERMAGDCCNSRKRTNPNAAAIFRLYEVETSHPAQIDDGARGEEIFLHEAKEIDATGLYDIAPDVRRHRIRHGGEGRR